jgi:hypothetical protein
MTMGYQRSPRTHKRCPRCKGFLPVESFGPNKRSASGLNSWCKSCCVEATLASRRRLAGYSAQRGISATALTRRGV